MNCKKCGKNVKLGTLVCPNCGYHIPLKNVIGDIFKSAKEHWKGDLSNNVYYVYNVPEKVQIPIRKNFGISSNEYVFLVCDNSTNATRDKGIVMTDLSIYLILEGHKVNCYPWNTIKVVQYKYPVFYFRGYVNPNRNYLVIPTSRFRQFENTHDDTAESFGSKLAGKFSLITKCSKPKDPLSFKPTSISKPSPLEEAIDKYQKLKGQYKETEAIEYALQCRNTIKGGIIFYPYITNFYLRQKEFQKIISLCNEGLILCKHDDSLETKMKLLRARYLAYYYMGNENQSRKDCLTVVKNATDKSMKDEAENDFIYDENAYVEEFLHYPYNERKILLPVKEYTDLNQDYLSVINIQNLPAIEFPNGHPNAYQLYIGHPFIENKYIPFEDNYEFELIKDKVREFCLIAKNLGATEISIESNVGFNLSSSAAFRKASPFVSVSKQTNTHLIDVISQTINLHQKFSPIGGPTLPPNLVWYPNEPSWQDLYEQRMHGSISQYSERIETCNHRLFDVDELKAIKEEFKTLLLDANIHWNDATERMFEQHENEILSIQVKFSHP